MVTLVRADAFNRENLAYEKSECFQIDQDPPEVQTGDAYQQKLYLEAYLDDGYKLNYLGYDFLAIYTLMRRGTLAKVMSQVGIGKESDIFLCQDHTGKEMILKLARLGRTSFKTIKNNRDYLQGRTQFNWLYLSRLATTKEYTYMQALHKEGFPTPTPVDNNRHAIIMTRIDGVSL